MLEYVQKFERIVYAVLIAMLMILLVFGLGQLAYTFWVSAGSTTLTSTVDNWFTNLLGGFLLVLIAVELLDTMIEYLRDSRIHVEVVVLLAIIAISRKVILLNPTTSNGFELIGIGVVIIGLAGAYFLLKKAGYTLGSKGIEKQDQKEQLSG